MAEAQFTAKAQYDHLTLNIDSTSSPEPLSATELNVHKALIVAKSGNGGTVFIQASGTDDDPGAVPLAAGDSFEINPEGTVSFVDLSDYQADVSNANDDIDVWYQICLTSNCQ